MKPSRLPLVTTILVLVFFYLPIAALVIRSFNASRYTPAWKGFTWKWYERLWEREDLLSALGNSLKIATAASLLSMVLGTTAAFALHRHRSRLQDFHSLMVRVPLVLPDILMGMSLLLLFVSAGVPLSLITITLAHVTFCLSYVALVVLARLEDFDFNVVEAARDLGATPLQAFAKITLPMLLPGILAGGLLAFTLSIDDYVITFFVKGPGSDTLPTLIYSMIKKSRELPVINALSTLMLAITFAVVFAAQRLTRKA
ncbi:spermidine/putrescine transport system permease protein [Haloferula luteola]|uniref:Spermidine/putrescine transport system permease protein n=1 Tax=Haloferula luteola TaxID=595692 RepID=A0A840V6T7_9BACT|nr:spermidine/putrescine transport system permease protein [Haloferula luteola]